MRIYNNNFVSYPNHVWAEDEGREEYFHTYGNLGSSWGYGDGANSGNPYSVRCVVALKK